MGCSGRPETTDASTQRRSRRGNSGWPWRRRGRLLVAAGAAASLLLAGCSSSGGGGHDKNVITFANWADAEQNTQPGIEAMIKEFEKENPGITVKSLPISYTDIEHQLVLQEQSGNTPDVAELQGNYTFSLNAAGALQPLDSYADAQFKQSVIPQELQLGNIDSKLVAIPWTVAPFALWYNKKVMQQAGLAPKAPTTWDELLSDLAVIHQKLPKIIAFGTDSTNRTYGLDQNWPVMKSFGATPFNGTTPPPIART